MCAMKHIGIYMDRQRAWSRRLCEGIAAYAQTVPDWSLSMLDADDIRDAGTMRTFNGFIARIQTNRTAQLFRRTGRLVADISSEKFLGGALLRGVMQACRTAGAAVPQEVAVLGVDNDTLICNFTTPSISSIDPDAFALGQAAAEYLDRRLDGDATDSAPQMIGPKELVVRGSTDTFPVDPPWLAEALMFLRRNIGRHITASDVYAHVGLSHTCVNSMFRAKLGSTVQKTIRKTALAEAQRMLSTTDLPVAEIARRSGFASHQYFCRVFTHEFGASPSARRKN